MPLYFRTWSLDELLQCWVLCYQTIEEATVITRFQKYGGVACYVFWQQEDLPSLENVVMDSHARKSIWYVSKVFQLFPSSHMLLHIVLTSHHVDILLFSKYYQETLENLKSLLDSEGATSTSYSNMIIVILWCVDHLKVCTPLICTFEMHPTPGDDDEFHLELKQHNMVVFNLVSVNLSDDNYYIPLLTKFSAVIAITKKMVLQYIVSKAHPIKGVGTLRLYTGNTFPLT